MKVLYHTGFGETRTILTENDIPVEIIIHRDLVLNAGDIVRAKIKAFHSVLKGYFAETDKGDVFIPTSNTLTEGETVNVRIIKEARADKVATAHFSDQSVTQTESKGTEISAEQVDEIIDEAMAPDICLKNGGILRIERTRVCWTIDVDSGNSSDSLIAVNEIAVEEIVHQIRLKNMGGLILIDFAGSKRGKTAVALKNQIQKAFMGQKDVLVRGWTKSGLLEIERKRFRADLWTLCAEDNPVNVYYRVRRAIDRCRLKHPVLTVSLPVFKLFQQQELRIKIKPACEVPVSYFSLEEEK